MYRLVSIALLISSPAAAFDCSPTMNTARILDKPLANSLHKDWTGENEIGLSWSLKGRYRVRDTFSGQEYLQGDLISPRGSVVNKGVYVLPAEWFCKP